MKKIKFLRNYGNYKKNQVYTKVDIEDKEKEILIKNGTAIEVEVADEVLEVVAEQELNITQTFLKENHKDVYDALIEKGKKSRDKEVEGLVAEIEALKKQIEGA